MSNNIATAEALGRLRGLSRSGQLGGVMSEAINRVVRTCESDRAALNRVRAVIRAADMRDIVPPTYTEIRQALVDAIEPATSADTVEELIALADDITPTRTLSARETQLLRTAAELLADADRDDS